MNTLLVTSSLRDLSLIPVWRVSPQQVNFFSKVSQPCHVETCSAEYVVLTFVSWYCVWSLSKASKGCLQYFFPFRLCSLIVFLKWVEGKLFLSIMFFSVLHGEIRMLSFLVISFYRLVSVTKLITGYKKPKWFWQSICICFSQQTVFKKNVPQWKSWCFGKTIWTKDLFHLFLNKMGCHTSMEPLSLLKSEEKYTSKHQIITSPD